MQAGLVADHHWHRISHRAQTDAPVVAVQMNLSALDDVVRQLQQIHAAALQRPLLIQSRQQQQVIHQRPIRCVTLLRRDRTCPTLCPARWPRRYNSEYPRIVVSGVRSSWLASATKRRMLFRRTRLRERLILLVHAARDAVDHGVERQRQLPHLS